MQAKRETPEWLTNETRDVHRELFANKLLWRGIVETVSQTGIEGSELAMWLQALALPYMEKWDERSRARVKWDKLAEWYVSRFTRKISI